MSSTFNGVTFNFLVTDTAYVPDWTQDSNVSIRHIPYSTTDDVQFGGRGNHRLSMRIYVTSLANINTLRTSLDGTARTLTLEGTGYANTYLIGVSDERRIAKASRVHYEATLEFTRAGT